MLTKIFRRLFGRMDSFLLASLMLVIFVGLVVLYSASGQNMQQIASQLMNLAVAVVIMWIFSNIPPQQLARLALPIYVLGMVLLVAVAVVGQVRLGARRWLSLGVTSIQPSELMKIAAPMMLAWYLDKKEGALRWRDFLVAGILLLLPVGLILKQPDLGTGILIAASGFYVMFLAGLSWKVMAGGILAFAGSAPLLWHHLHDYQQQRILTLIDPTKDPLGAGYHIIQSTIAIGSGGLFGKGWLHGTQSQLQFLPESHTDFIFAVFGEEFGLVGNLVLLTLFLIVIGRGLVIAANAPTQFSRLLGGSLVLTFFTYAFVNMGMVSGILPVVGVPLPLISYGGTSLVTLMLGFGILMSINSHRKLVQT